MGDLKFKVCRRLGENIWQNKKLTPRQNTIIRLLIKKNTNRKQSDFSKKLQQIKKLSYFYGMRTLTSNTCSIQACRRLDKKKSLLLALEARLDVILVRIYFCSTLNAARQLIAHNKICVNYHVVNIPGFTVRNGDIISILPSHLDLVKCKAPFVLRQSLYASFVGPSEPTLGLLESMQANPLAPVLLRSRTLYRSLELRQSLPYPSKVGPSVAPSYHLEVNYKTFNAVLLYEPVEIHFPYKIDLDFLF